MRSCLAVHIFMLLLASSCRIASAQVVIIQNGIAVPEDRVHAIYSATCRVVADEFQLKRSSDLRFPITLVLGDKNERVIGDELHQTYFIYMDRWNEALFAASTSRLALQHMLTQERKTKIVAEILRRAHRSAPVTYQSLQRP